MTLIYLEPRYLIERLFHAVGVRQRGETAQAPEESTRQLETGPAVVLRDG